MRKFNIKVNGKEYEVEVEEVGKSPSQKIINRPEKTSIERKVESPEKIKKDIRASVGEETIEAPMPGTILSLNVSVGDPVEEGDILLILEAMKMENEILAPVSGIVKAIGVESGNTVDTGEKLIIIQ